MTEYDLILGIKLIYSRKPQIKDCSKHDDTGSTTADLLRHRGRLLRDAGKTGRQ